MSSARPKTGPATTKRVSDGPNYLAPMGFTAFRPPHGKRFLHIYLRIRKMPEGDPVVRLRLLAFVDEGP